MSSGVNSRERAFLTQVKLLFLSDDKASNDSAIKAAQWQSIVRENVRGIRRCGV